MIDTHVHLEDEAFAPDRPQVIQRARAAGIELMLNAGSSRAANAEALALAAVTPEVYAAAGLHPHEFPRTPLAGVQELAGQLCQDKIAALGEIGLDYHLFPDYPAPDRDAQQAAFAAQLRLARIFELPVIVHVREAYADALRLLRAAGGLARGGVLHSYSGGTENLDAGLDLGFHFGLGGPMTYPKADSLRAAVRAMPGERLLLETDAPYLPPQSRRGQRNEPAYLAEVMQAVAACRGEKPDQVAAQTAANARRLFRLEEKNPGRFVYPVGKNLYVNLTNRCSARCRFCPRLEDRGLHGVDLTLRREPLAAEIVAAIGDPLQYRDVVFCGFGEPLLRLPALLAVGREVKARGGRVRVNTNGQADVIFGRDILPECAGAVDEWSVSLNTADPEQYLHLVRPATGPETFSAVLAFIGRAVQQGFAVTVTAVDLPGVDLARVEQIARQAGARFRGRPAERLSK